MEDDLKRILGCTETHRVDLTSTKSRVKELTTPRRAPSWSASSSIVEAPRPLQDGSFNVNLFNTQFLVCSIWKVNVSVGTDKHTILVMEGDEGGRRAGELSENPLLAHLVFVKMEEIMDKLKLLDYETGFCKKLKFKPFPRQAKWFQWPHTSTSFHCVPQTLLCSSYQLWRTVLLIHQPGCLAHQPQRREEVGAATRGMSTLP